MAVNKEGKSNPFEKILSTFENVKKKENWRKLKREKEKKADDISFLFEENSRKKNKIKQSKLIKELELRNKHLAIENEFLSASLAEENWKKLKEKEVNDLKVSLEAANTKNATLMSENDELMKKIAQLELKNEQQLKFPLECGTFITCYPSVPRVTGQDSDIVCNEEIGQINAESPTLKAMNAKYSTLEAKFSAAKEKWQEELAVSENELDKIRQEREVLVKTVRTLEEKLAKSEKRVSELKQLDEEEEDWTKISLGENI